MALLALTVSHWQLAKWHSRYIWSGILFLKRELIMEQVVDTPEKNIQIVS